MTSQTHTFIRYLRRIMHTCVSVSLMLIDSIFLYFFSVQKENDVIKKRVLIVRLDAIGDFILWLSSAVHIRRLYPPDTHTITLLGNDLWTALAEGLDSFDEVWPLNRHKFNSNIFYRLGQLKKIRDANFDIVIQPTFSRELNFGDAVVRLSGAEVKIGSAGDFSNIRPLQKRIGDRWYTRLIPATRTPLMELGRNAEFLRGLGLQDAHAALPMLPFVKKELIPVQVPYYMILFPGASDPIKQWPLDSFVNIARKMHQSIGWTVVVCGGSADQHLGEKFQEINDFPIINKVGKTSLSELASLVAGAMLLVGNDTSAIHIASSVSTPSICIAGGGHYGRFVPYRVEKGSTDRLPVVVTSKKDCFGCNWRCIYPRTKHEPAPCISDVSVDEVWREVVAVVDKIQIKD